MATEKSPGVSFPPISTGRHSSPPPQQLRHRPLTRAATLSNVAATPTLGRRRSSIFSESLSEARRSLRDSTDDLLLPRLNSSSRLDIHEEPSHWHSLPLGLALLPAIAGLFFQDGSAFITDITLLFLGAVFLNWALRSPWDWYRSAQAVRVYDPQSPPSFEIIEEEEVDENQEDAIASSQETALPSKARETSPKSSRNESETLSAAQRELRAHELIALASCFISPILGAWLLHAIRSQLSRPSEGLISNYNLTIFLLGAEIRPISHVLKMIQRRTMYLQRQVSTMDAAEEAPALDNNKLLEVSQRIEELESVVAESTKAVGKGASGSPEAVAAKASAQASSDFRKGIQPELDALNRAVRRYEKRMTISAIQTEARLQDLETRLKDVVVLAAAAQRNVESLPNNFIVILLNWICAAIVLPVQYTSYLLALPSKGVSSAWNLIAGFTGFKSSKRIKDSKMVRRAGGSRTRERKDRTELQ